jgi:hypothetical protein
MHMNRGRYFRPEARMKRNLLYLLTIVFITCINAVSRRSVI